MKLNELSSYLIWKLVLTKPTLSTSFFIVQTICPNTEKSVAVGLASVYINCQEEPGLYRADKATGACKIISRRNADDHGIDESLATKLDVRRLWRKRRVVVSQRRCDVADCARPAGTCLRAASRYVCTAA